MNTTAARAVTKSFYQLNDSKYHLTKFRGKNFLKKIDRSTGCILKLRCALKWYLLKT